MAVKVDSMKPLEPSGIGLVVVELKYVKIKEISRHSKPFFDKVKNKEALKNIVRPDGINETHVGKFRTLIVNKGYRPYHNIPPVVILIDGIYYLLSGEHRYSAHLHEHKTEMWVAICRFEDAKGMPADYWASTYQSTENDDAERLDMNVRTDAGIISVTKNQIKQGWITDSEEDLKKSLKHQNVKGSIKIQNLVNRIQANLGLPGSVKWTMNEDCIAACLEQGQKVPDIIRSMNNKGGIDGDYDWRIIKTIIDKLEEDPNAMIDVATYHVGMNADEVVIARELKDKLSRPEILKYASKLISLVHDGTFENQVTFKYFGQLEGEGLYAE